MLSSQEVYRHVYACAGASWRASWWTRRTACPHGATTSGAPARILRCSLLDMILPAARSLQQQSYPGTQTLLATSCEQHKCAVHWLLEWAEAAHVRAAVGSAMLESQPVGLSSGACACRPDYREIGKLRKQLPGVPVTALTATATGEVRRDITKSLKFGPTAAEFKQSFFRHNLFIRFCAKGARGRSEDVLVKYLQALERSDRSAAAIVYCSSRAQCVDVATGLQNAGLRAAAYHAGLPPAKRHAAQTDWQAGAQCGLPLLAQCVGRRCAAMCWRPQTVRSTWHWHHISALVIACRNDCHLSNRILSSKRARSVLPGQT